MISLNIVSHPDDDLLFLNPDILEDIENGKEPIVFYITVGDDGQGCEYYEKRIEAIHEAYKFVGDSYGYHNHRLPYASVKSNSFRNGDIYGSLYKMWHDHAVITDTVSNSVGWSSPYYTYENVIGMIKQGIEYYKPDMIRTHDPDTEPAIDKDGETLDHIDHIYTAKFVQAAAKSFPTIPVYAYMGYPIRHQPENVLPELAEKKLAMWRKYQEIDTSVAGEQWDLASKRCYKRRIQ